MPKLTVTKGVPLIVRYGSVWDKTKPLLVVSNSLGFHSVQAAREYAAKLGYKGIKIV